MRLVKYFITAALGLSITFTAFAQVERPPITEPLALSEKSMGLTLWDCYTLALKRSETIAIQKEIINETEGQMLQALSTALPRVSFLYAKTWQDNGHDQTLSQSYNSGRFTFTQPLFTGFREIAAVKGSRYLTRQREQELKRAEQLLFTDVSDAFYLSLSYQEISDVLMKTRDALIERVSELKRRENLGRSRTSEVASAESRLLKTEAALERISGQSDVAKELLEFLIGQPVDRLSDTRLLPEESTLDITAYETKAGSRPDVLAAKEAVEVFRKHITVARSAFFPSVFLSGNRYTKNSDTFNSDWDVTLSVNVPLFNGLNDVGQVKEAKARFNEAELSYNRAKRRALLDVRSAFVQWQANKRRVAALVRAVDASNRNYALQVEDYQRNLVNNLDVLESLTELENVRADLVSAQSDLQRSFSNLQVATGEIYNDAR